MKKNNDLRIAANNVEFYFTEFKMWYDANGKKQKNVGVLVESKSNELLFRKLLHSTCKFFPMEGWKNVENVVEQANKYNIKFAIGIIDADFRRITQPVTELENLFLTDFHDTEIMSIYSEAWENVLNSYMDKILFEDFEKQISIDFRTYLMEIAKPIGVLRLLNEEENLGLKFKTRKKDNTYDFIDYQNFTDSKTLKIDIDKLLKTVENKSMNLDFFKKNPVLYEKYKTKLEEEFDLKELNNGHDILNLLSIALSEAIGKRKSSSKVSGATLEDDFIKVYRKEDFALTNLYVNLKHWETLHLDYFLVN